MPSVLDAVGWMTGMAYYYYYYYYWYSAV